MLGAAALLGTVLVASHLIAPAVLSALCPGATADHAALRLWPRLGLDADGVAVRAPDGAWRLIVDHVEADIPLAWLFGVRAAVTGVRLDHPVLQVEHGLPALPRTALAQWPSLTITDGTVQAGEWQATNLAAAAIPVGVDRQSISARANVNGTPVSATLEVASGRALLSGDALPFVLEVSEPLSVRAVGRLEAVNDGFQVHDLVAVSGQTHVGGTMALDGLSSRAQLSADLAVDRLDLASLPSIDHRLLRSLTALAHVHVETLEPSASHDVALSIEAASGAVRIKADAADRGTLTATLDLRGSEIHGRLRGDLHDISAPAIVPSLTSAGTLALQFDLQAAGPTIASLVERLRGSATLDGAVVARPPSPSDEETPLTVTLPHVAGTWRADGQGSAHLTGVAAEPPLRADGTVDLRTGTIDLTVQAGGIAPRWVGLWRTPHPVAAGR